MSNKNKAAKKISLTPYILFSDKSRDLFKSILKRTICGSLEIILVEDEHTSNNNIIAFKRNNNSPKTKVKYFRLINAKYNAEVITKYFYEILLLTAQIAMSKAPMLKTRYELTHTKWPTELPG